MVFTDRTTSTLTGEQLRCGIIAMIFQQEANQTGLLAAMRHKTPSFGQVIF